MDPPLGTEPEEEKAPETHENNFHKKQLCGACQGEKETGSPVAPEDSGMARGDITLGRAQLDERDSVAWHAQRLEGSTVVLALKSYRRSEWQFIIAVWPGFIHVPQSMHVPRTLQGPFLFDFEEELPIRAA